MVSNFEQNKFEKSEGKQREVFIEIGTDILPITRLGKKEFSPNSIYIGIDKNKQAIAKAKKLFSKDKNINYIITDAEKLPLADGSADQVFLGNVLGAPFISREEKDKFIDEAKRVLKQNGTLVIKENSTPAWTETFPTRREFLDSFVKKHDLVIERLVEVGTPEWEEAIKDFDTFSSPSENSGAFIAFLKPDRDTSKVTPRITSKKPLY